MAAQARLPPHGAHTPSQKKTPLQAMCTPFSFTPSFQGHNGLLQHHWQNTTILMHYRNCMVTQTIHGAGKYYIPSQDIFEIYRLYTFRVYTYIMKINVSKIDTETSKKCPKDWPVACWCSFITWTFHRHSACLSCFITTSHRPTPTQLLTM